MEQQWVYSCFRKSGQELANAVNGLIAPNALKVFFNYWENCLVYRLIFRSCLYQERSEQANEHRRASTIEI